MSYIDEQTEISAEEEAARLRAEVAELRGKVARLDPGPRTPEAERQLQAEIANAQSAEDVEAILWRENLHGHGD